MLQGESKFSKRGPHIMHTTAKPPAITPLPVQLSQRECNACIFPPLSRPKRGPRCKLGDHRLLNLILWVLYTGMPWKCWPLPPDTPGKPELHDTNISRAFATWADDGSLQQAFMASVAHLSDEKTLDLRVLHGDGTNTVAQKGGLGLATRATSTSRGRRSSPSPPPRAMSSLPYQSHPCMKRIWCCGQRVYQPCRGGPKRLV
jgi:transposase